MLSPKLGKKGTELSPKEHEPPPKVDVFKAEASLLR